MESHTLRSVQEMLGLSRSAIVRLIEMGLVKPRRGPRRGYLFSFQDVVLLRTAHELRKASIPVARMVRALHRLKAEMPADAPLSGLRITAVGREIVVRSGASQWAADTGQMLMDFDVGVQGAAATTAVVREFTAAGPPPAPEPVRLAADLFARAEALEEVDVAEAKRIYRQAISVAPDYTIAYLNLGALLCDGGDCDEAVRVFTKGLQHRPAEPLLHFNRAVALEDLSRFAEALTSYDMALQLDPDLADAHFNAGRLHDELGHPQRAIRHFSAYRRLSR